MMVENNLSIMKIIPVTFCVLLFVVFSCGSSHEKKAKNVKEEKFTHTTSSGPWINGKSTKVYEGNFFDSKLKTRVLIEYVADKNVRLSFYKLNSGNWILGFSDSLPMMYFMCDTLVDLNGDGSKELVVQKFSGMGSITDYYHRIYTFEDGHFCKLSHMEILPNISFQPKMNSFTSFEKSESLHIGKTFVWNSDLSYTCKKMQVVQFANDKKCLKKNYRLKNGVQKLLNVTENELIDSAFWGFQNWCQ